MLRINPDPSECTGGCESGWTMYLEQSYGKPAPHAVFYDGKKEEEEDLSMVSDASSGPQQLHSHPSFGDDYYIDYDSYNDDYFGSASSMALQKNIDKRRMLRTEEPDASFLEDTATSAPVLRFSKQSSINPTKNPPSMEQVIDFSQGFSATRLKGKVTLQKHLGLLQSVLPSSKPIRRGESRNKI